MKKQRAQKLARTIGARVRRIRESLGITQDEASERIGITVEYYARIERGKSLPSLLTFAQIAVALDVSADALIGRIDTKDRPAEAPPAWFAPPDQEESPQLRRLHRRLRRGPPELVAAVDAVLKQLERFIAGKRKKRPRGRS
jgi:transcriptional regulator with XRE-family HTH domain